MYKRTYKKQSSPKPESSAQQILLERQGTMWEGSGKKELPKWMTQPEESTPKQETKQKNPLVRVGHLLATALRTNFGS